jgi:type II secretory pathway component GspD/PulD (secretin)
VQTFQEPALICNDLQLSDARIREVGLIEDGKLLFRMGKLNESETKFNRALQENPQRQESYYYLNLIREARQNEAFTNVLQTGPNSSTNLLVQRILKVDPNKLQTGLRRALGLGENTELVPVQTAENLQKALKDFFTSIGADLSWPKVIWFKDREGMLLVRATPQDLEKIELGVGMLNTAPPQIQVSTTFIESPEDTVNKFLDRLGGFGVVSNLAVLLPPTEARKERAALERLPGTELLDEPSLTTLSGRQAQIATTDYRTILGIDPRALTAPGVSNQEAIYATSTFPDGSSLDVYPSMGTNGNDWEIEMECIASVAEFLGYDQPTNLVRVCVNGEWQSVVPPLPRIKVRQITAHASIPDGYTLVLGKPVDGRGQPAEIPGVTKRNLLVFVTPMLIDPAGNRLHTDDEIEEITSKTHK